MVEDEVREAVRASIAAGVFNFAVAGVFAPTKPEQETLVGEVRCSSRSSSESLLLLLFLP